MKNFIFSALFLFIAAISFAQVSVSVTGPTGNILAQTLTPYTVTVNFTTNEFGIVPAQDLCACSALLISTMDNTNHPHGDIYIGNVNYGPELPLAEIGCELNPFDNYHGDPSPSESTIFTKQSIGSTKTTWIYNISVKWYIPSGSDISGTLLAKYKCDNYSASGSITNGLFPRKPTVNVQTNCSSSTLQLSAQGNVTNSLGSSIGFQVEESLDGGNTWNIIFNQLNGVPRSQWYNPSNPTASRKIRARMFAILSGNIKIYSGYSDINTFVIDDRPTLITGPGYLSSGNYMPFYSVFSAGPNNMFSIEGASGVSVSFLTPPNHSNVYLQVTPPASGGYFSLVAKGTAGCGLPYTLTRGVIVSSNFGSPREMEDRIDNEQQQLEQNEVLIQYTDHQLEIITANTAEKNLTLVGVDGRVILNKSFHAESSVIELNSDITPGIYFAQVICQGKVTQKKILFTN